MKKLKIQDSEIMQIALQQEIARSEEARYDNKLHGLLLACNGMSSYAIARIFGRGARTIEYWIQRFNKEGFAGLREKEGRGRPSAISEKEMTKISKALRKTPRDFGYAQNVWDGKILSDYISTILDKKIGVRQCQRLFRKLGFRFRKPHPVIAKASPEVQKSFKKTQFKKKKGKSGDMVN